jgi:hypothetical protein
MSPFIIGISGKLGSGKSLATLVLIKLFQDEDVTAVEKSFARRLKETIATLFNTSVETQLSQEGKNTVDPVVGKTYGQLQQILGQGLRDLIQPDLWIKLALSNLPEDEVSIISDVRYKNEVKAILERGGIVIRLEGDPGGVRAKSNRDLTHSSECDLDDWEDWFLKIDNSIPDLEALEKKLQPVIANVLESVSDSQRHARDLKRSTKEEHERNVIAYKAKKPALNDGWWALFETGKFIGQWESKVDLLKIVDFCKQGYIVRVGWENVGTEIS